MNKLQKAVEKMDLNAVELAQAIAKIVKEEYGSHNFKAFKAIINQQLMEVKSEKESKENRLEELYELQGAIKSKKVAWIGDSNNVCMTWLQAAELLDFELHVSTPKGYEVQLKDIDSKNNFFQHEDPMDAAKNADIVTTDVWTSMGFESENKERLKDFANWQVDKKMMNIAKKDALFMHCLPAHRGEEVTGEVIDGPQSIVWEEAENRLHVQKALLEYLLLGKQ